MARKNITQIPFLMLAREDISLIYNKLTVNEQYSIFKGLCCWFLTGTEPDYSNNRALDIVWEGIKATTERKLEAYNNSIETGTNNLQKVNAKRKANKAVVDTNTGEIIETFEKEYSNDTGIRYNEENNI